jgi:hypothetical protein
MQVSQILFAPFQNKKSGCVFFKRSTPSLSALANWAFALGAFGKRLLVKGGVLTPPHAI